MNPHLDYYAILGIEQRAGPAEIKRAFREKARRYHPDVNADPDAVERFKEINEAYRILSDRRQRETYDARRLMLYAWGSGGIRGDRDPGVEEILRRWRTQPPPPRSRPPSGPFANRRNRRRLQRSISFWLMTSSLMCVLLATAWALSFRAVESEVATPAPAVVVEPSITPTPIGERPRRIDIWTIFGPDQLNYVTLVYPAFAAPEGDPVELLLPFEGESWDVLIFNDYYGARRVDVGGDAEFDGSQLLVIPDSPPETAQFPEAYGVDLQFRGASLLREDEGWTDFEFILRDGGDFEEWYVVVAVPQGSLGGAGVDQPDLYPHVEDYEGWQLTYYDVALALRRGSVQMRFDLTEPPALAPDPYIVDSLRQ